MHYSEVRTQAVHYEHCDYVLQKDLNTRVIILLSAKVRLRGCLYNVAAFNTRVGEKFLFPGSQLGGFLCLEIFPTKSLFALKRQENFN